MLGLAVKVLLLSWHSRLSEPLLLLLTRELTWLELLLRLRSNAVHHHPIGAAKAILESVLELRLLLPAVQHLGRIGVCSGRVGCIVHRGYEGAFAGD